MRDSAPYCILATRLAMLFVTSDSSPTRIMASATGDRRECTCLESTASSAPLARDSLNDDKKGLRDSSPKTSSWEKPTRLVRVSCVSRSAEAGPACSNSGLSVDVAAVSEDVLDMGQAPSAQNSFPTRASPPWHTSLDSAARQTSANMGSRWGVGMASE